MKGYQYLNEQGVFQLNNPELTGYLYFPLANESGVMASVTPTLGGDNKMGQNTFLLAAVSSEDLHNNRSTRNFWCHIRGKGIWSATGVSAKQISEVFSEKKEETLLEAGKMWHKVKRLSKKLGLASEVLSYVPYTKDRVELMIVTLANEGDESLSIVPTAAIPLYGRSADNIRDHRNVTSLLHRTETTKTGLVLNPTLTFDERGHRKNTMCYGVFGWSEDGQEPEGFYPCVETFIGEGGSFEHPEAIVRPEIKAVPSGATLDGYEALGGIRFQEITLEPGKSKSYIIVMGYGNSKESLEETAGKFNSLKACKEIFEKTKEYWEEKVNVSYRTGSRDFDAWMHWVNFQPMLRRIYGCSFLPHHDYGRGGRGWRDLWQDCLALLIMNPSGVRDMLIGNFAGVRMDGTNATIIGSKQGEFIADRNNITRVWMDHGVWPFLTVHLYIMQSGDLDILLDKNSYFKDLQAVRGDEKDLLWKPEDGNHVKTPKGDEYQGTILEHMLLEHLTAFYDVGEHNHIRLRGADWNDALDMAKERGESVAFTALYGSNLNKMADLLVELKKRGVEKVTIAKEIQLLLIEDTDLYEDIVQKQNLLAEYCNSCRHTISGEVFEISCEALANNLRKKADWIISHIREKEWITGQEGNSWFNGYYDNHGLPVEGSHEKGVRMMLTSQVFAIMSEVATKDQVEKIVCSADKYLYDSNIGGYKLNTNFKEVKTDLGRMFGFAYGHKENGAVFSHMAVMYANALYQRGFAAEGFKVINSLYTHCSNFEKSRIYPGIPEYIGDNGRGLYHYLTGSASWMLLTVLTEMFGVKGYYGDLLLEPKLMLDQFDEKGEASVQLVFANRKLELIFKNKDKKEADSYRVGRIKINGKEYQYSDRVVIYRSDITGLKQELVHEVIIELI